MKTSIGAKFKLTSIGLAAIAVVIGSSWAIYTLIRVQHFTQNREPAAIKEAPAPVVVAPFEFSYELTNLSMQVTDETGRHSGYVQFSMTLEMPNAEAKHWMELNRAKLISIVIDAGNHFSIDDLKHAEGMDRFKKRIARVYSEEFKAYAPKSLTIQDWVMN